MFTVYILFSPDYNRFYVGQCQDIELRLIRHNKKLVLSTKSYTPWLLMYKEEFDTRAQAVQRESYIKKQKSRSYIQQLVECKKQVYLNPQTF